MPVPAYEEEIEETGEEFTLEDLEREEARRRERLHGRRESPYLMFEITSEDGFHVRSESWEGKFVLQIKLLIKTGTPLSGNLIFEAKIFEHMSH